MTTLEIAIAKIKPAMCTSLKRSPILNYRIIYSAIAKRDLVIALIDI